MLHRVQVTDTSTVQRRLRESGLHGQIAAKKPLLKYTNNKKKEETCLGQETRAMDIRLVDICPLVWWVKIWDFWFQLPCLLRHRVGERIISTCVVPTVKHGGGGVMVWWCFSGDTVCDLFRIRGTLHQHGYHSILQRYPIPSGLSLVGLSFVFQQDNDPKHTSRLCKGYLTKKESDGAASDGLASTITQPQPN